MIYIDIYYSYKSYSVLCIGAYLNREPFASETDLTNWSITQQEVIADEIGRVIQAVALHCGISPTGSNTTTGANPQNSWSVGGDPLENPSGKEHAEWDFALYKNILLGVASQRK